MSRLNTRSLLILLFSSMVLMGAYSQQNNSPNEFWRNVRFGGGLGLGFGNNSFSFAISPSAIYVFSDQFALGPGLNYNYSEFDDSRFSALGISLMNFYNPIPSLQLSAEFQQTYVSRRDEFLNERFEEKYWIPALFLGVGFGNRNVMVGMRYDVLYDDDRSIFINPWVPFVRVFF